MGGLLGVFGPAAAGFGAASAAPTAAALSAGVRGVGYALDGELTHRGRFAVAFTGELYNRDPLREILLIEPGPVSDADLVAAAHRRWGAAAPQYLRGNFAYLARDSRTGRLSGARDRFGTRSLCYAQVAGNLLVAADSRSLVDIMGGAHAVAPDGLARYLGTGSVPEPGTIRRAVFRLPAGSTLDYAAGERVRVGRYWRPHFAPARVPFDAAADAVRSALRESVAVRVARGEPAGVLLSGGLASTGLAALAARVEPGVRAFAVGFEAGGFGAGDFDAARRAAGMLGLPLTEVFVTPGDVIAELPRILGQLGEPVGDPAAVPLWFLARAAARQVGTVLSGVGADELFAGPGYRRAASLAPLAEPALDALRAAGRRLLRSPAAATHPATERTAGAADGSAATAANGPTADARDGPTAGTANRPAEGATHEPAGNGPAAGAVARPAPDAVAAMQAADLLTRLPGVLATADRLAAVHGLRLRTPFLDPAVVAAATRLPERYRLLRYGPGRRALRRALRDLVPDRLPAHRRLSALAPIDRWLRGEVGEWAETVFAGSAAGDVIDVAHVRALLHAHWAGSTDNADRVWVALTFCVWHAAFLDRGRDAEPARPEAVEHMF
ncbi:asparagine synthetase B family protein [Rhizomonospora bruguierae]|uniref:asparagine synthetase B family protein n=1 Tax=Rhizomonospora bruguierae TaxID=1581705 RepID=UPI001BCE8F19|nr:asparagine synthase-related protein [Micromonospora sp. NBRC 107566]